MYSFGNKSDTLINELILQHQRFYGLDSVELYKIVIFVSQNQLNSNNVIIMLLV